MIDRMVGLDGRARPNAIDRALSGRIGLQMTRAETRLIRTSQAVGWRGAFMVHGWINEGAMYDGLWSWMRVTLSIPPSQQLQGVTKVQAPLAPSRGVVERDGAYITLNIDPKAVETYLHRTIPEAVVMDAARRMGDDALVAHLLQALDADVASGSPSGPVLGEAVIAAILHRLEGWRSGPSLDLPRGLSARDRRMIQDLIDARLSTPIHLDDLAKLLGVSVRQMCRDFPAAFGTSPHQYILDQRLERAVVLLTTSKLPLDDVADRCGFADQSHMTSTFRRRRGLTPLQIRNSSK